MLVHYTVVNILELQTSLQKSTTSYNVSVCEYHAALPLFSLAVPTSRAENMLLNSMRLSYIFQLSFIRKIVDRYDI